MLNREKMMPKEKWVYCYDPVDYSYISFEEILYIRDTKIKLEEPVMEIYASIHIAVRTKSKIFLISRFGQVLWEKRSNPMQSAIEIDS